MKINNQHLKNVWKETSDFISKNVEGAEELLESDCVVIHSRQPSWRMRHRRNGKVDHEIGGIDIRVEPWSAIQGHPGPDPIVFGVRTDHDGMIDLGKLANKFSDKIEEIRLAVKQHDENVEYREKARQSEASRRETLAKLEDEGTIEDTYEYSSVSNGYKASITLENSGEIIMFEDFKKKLLNSRRAAHGVVG